MKVRKTYSGEFKAKIVRSWINNEKTLLELATENNLHPNQIKNWKSQLLKRAENILADRRRKQSAA